MVRSFLIAFITMLVILGSGFLIQSCSRPNEKNIALYGADF
ncbi:hypothetical protein [Silvanigrella paludirubra]|nr:hypothetical protein [Silvanigrella paludirubra]